QAARSRQMAGISFFFYETLWNLTAEPTVDRQTTLRRLFSAPALRPSLLQHWTPPN
ncbi:MAG: glycoside hydrolase family 10 protein, partial [Leptolyngbyaceae cyanobacterium SL_7_1]|nr:glycoside hydrolase family 10 protein [Leptolyngbyaceae cyanobacterium SL_7_1]